MMNAKDTSKYTPQQLADAERFMQLLSRVPEDKSGMPSFRTPNP